MHWKNDLRRMLMETSGADLVEYGLIAAALLLTVAGAESSLTLRFAREINLITILGVTSIATALIGLVLPLASAIKGY